MSWEEWRANKEQSKAFARARRLRKLPCPKCEFHACICQLSLHDWIKPPVVYKKDACPICDLHLCDCPKDAFGDVIR